MSRLSLAVQEPLSCGLYCNFSLLACYPVLWLGALGVPRP